MYSPINRTIEKLCNLYNYHVIRKQFQKYFIISFTIHINISKAAHHISSSCTSHLTQSSHLSDCGIAWSSHGPFSCSYNHCRSSSDPSCSLFAPYTCISNMVSHSWIFIYHQFEDFGALCCLPKPS